MSSSIAFAQNKKSCEEKLAAAKAISERAMKLAEEAQEDAKAEKELAEEARAEQADTAKQRDEYREQRDNARREFDHLASRTATVEEDNRRLRIENREFISRDAAWKVKVKRLKRQRWYLAGAALVLGAAAGTYITIKVAPW